MSASNPHARRKAMAQKVSRQLTALADLLGDYNRVRRECGDDPRAHQANDGLLRLQIECNDLAGWLETAAPTWPSVPPDSTQ